MAMAVQVANDAVLTYGGYSAGGRHGFGHRYQFEAGDNGCG